MAGVWWLPCLPVVPLVWQDFRAREVSVAWLAAFAGCALVAAWIETGAREMLPTMGLNALILTGLLVVLWLWTKMRGRSLKASFGGGDAAFMAAATPLFESRVYVWFLLASCVGALALAGVKKWREVPLVGVMGVVAVLLRMARLWS